MASVIENLEEIMKISAACLVAVFVTASMVGCADMKRCRETGRRFENIDRVFIHQPGEYSILYHASADSRILSSETVGGLVGCNRSQCNESAVLIDDLAADQPIWAERFFKGTATINGFCETETVIHIHSAKEIDGAGWEIRQPGSFLQQDTIITGKTNVVE